MNKASDSSESLEFKQLTKENWLVPDDTMDLFVQVDRQTGEESPMSGEDWLEEILEPVLNEKVPKEVRALFEVARGSMVYGYLFYPLYAMGMSQLFRVVETAVKLKCSELEAPGNKRRYYDMISFLIEKGIIPPENEGAWTASRKLRNSFSHPDGQTIMLPAMTIGILRRIAEDINSLFE